MAYYFNNIFRMLDTPILMDFLLPFFLIFSVLFASLQKIKIFKEKKVNVLLSLVISLLVVIPHITNRYPPGSDVVEIMMNAIPQVAVLIIALIMLFIILGLFFGEKKFGGSSIGGWVSIIAIVAILWIFGSSAGWWSGWRSIERFFGEDIISLAIIIIVFALIIRFITSDPDKEPGEKFMDKVGDFFGAKK